MAHIAVIHKPHFHPFVCLLLQYLKERIPHISFVYNKIFHKDKLFRFPKLMNHILKLVLPKRKILDRRVAVRWEPSLWDR